MPRSNRLCWTRRTTPSLWVGLGQTASGPSPSTATWWRGGKWELRRGFESQAWSLCLPASTLSATSQRRAATSSAFHPLTILGRAPIWRFLERFILVNGFLLTVVVQHCLIQNFVTLISSCVCSEPSASVTSGLRNCTAVSDGEATFSVELSATCSGAWMLNGQLIRSGVDYLITRSKTTHTLVIRKVTEVLDGAQVKFVGGGSASVCTLSVKGKKNAQVNVEEELALFKKFKYPFHTIHNFIPVLAAPACFTKKYSEADIFTFSAHSSAQLYTEVSDASVQVITLECDHLFLGLSLKYPFHHFIEKGF